MAVLKFPNPNHGEPFDLDSIRLTPEMLATSSAAEPGCKKPRQRHPATPFVIAELGSAQAAAKALNTATEMLVWLFIVYETRRRRTDTVTLPNAALAKWGVSRKVKYAALLKLETAGLVSVLRSGKRSARARVNMAPGGPYTWPPQGQNMAP